MPASTARWRSWAPAQPDRPQPVGRALHALGVVAPFFTTPSVIERLRGVVDGWRGRLRRVLFSVENPQQRADALRDFARHDPSTACL